ncbi:hypothetical protein ABIF73_004429 [Bradyrhizobium japonicum]|uniref:hypothetical protein n=1 Tax=Bradyrhizobium japonicum TaxID=375 RepID=UPI00339366AE
MSLSQNVLELSQTVVAADRNATTETLNGALNKILSPTFRATAGVIVDISNARSAEFASVVHGTENGANEIRADDAAAVIDVVDELDLIAFRNSYSRISDAKRLAKSSTPRGVERSTATLGILYARKSIASLEDIAEELYRLNCDTDHLFWPDMVVVASVGVVNYAVQFPGEPVSGDFLPPHPLAFRNGTPPIYVVIVMRSTQHYTFNKMIAFLVSYLHVFQPAAHIKSLNWMEMLQGVPTSAVTLLGFQPNLKGQIVPVPRDEYNDRILPARPIGIEDQAGNALATIAYRKWQDGAIITLIGKLPLEGLLIFLPNVNPAHLRIVRRSGFQISYVLPVSQNQFNAFLNNLQQRSYFVINKNGPGFVVQKLMDEGVGTPFVARCWLGLLRLRENVYPNKDDRDAFDKIFQAVLSSVMAARTAAKNVEAKWQAHSAKIASGEIVRIEHGTVHILESIDKEIATEVETFVNTSVRSIKTGLQNLGNFLGADIGFLFKKKAAFDSGLERLQNSDPLLARYLEEVRNWTEPLIGVRNDLEHDLWIVPRISYTNNGGTVSAAEPTILGLGATRFTNDYADRVMCFVEDLVAHLLQVRMPAGVTVTEVKRADRTAEAPERFRITPAVGGAGAWEIGYRADRFEEI